MTDSNKPLCIVTGVGPGTGSALVRRFAAARTLGPKGVHCCYVATDAVIDVPWTREWYSDKPDDFFCQPADIAEECYRLAHQPRSAWTFDSVIRPFGENW